MDSGSRVIPDDEIDFGGIGKGLTTAISYPFILFWRHKWITFVFCLAAVCTAVALKYSLPKTYKSSFIIRPNDPKEKFHLKILADIQLLLKNREMKSVARELKLPEQIAETFAGLQTYNPTFKNSLDSINSTEITIWTTDYNSFNPLQTALLAYIENNIYFSKITLLQRQQVQVQLDRVNRDLVQLDSLKAVQLRNQSLRKTKEENTLVLSELINPTAVYAMTTDRTNRKTALLAQEVFNSNFQLVKGCIAVTHPASPPRILVMCLYTIPLSLLLCFFFLLLTRRKRAETVQN